MGARPDRSACRCIPRWRPAASLPVEVIATAMIVFALALLFVASAVDLAADRIAGR